MQESQIEDWDNIGGAIVWSLRIVTLQLEGVFDNFRYASMPAFAHVLYMVYGTYLKN